MAGELPRGCTYPLSCAPMVDRTDRHFRALLRRICPPMLLYTEMVPVGRAEVRDELCHEVRDGGPLAIQLGGGCPRALADAAARAYDLGYTEVNLNCGCPSSAATHGRFGACLMAEPHLVAECVAAMRSASPLPVTVKHRIGIDGRDRFEDLVAFVDTVASEGCDRFIVHARRAILTGLRPKDNRTRPPLRWSDVHALKRQRPTLRIELNGGITHLDAVAEHLEHVDGVMIGRAFDEDPCLALPVAARFYGDPREPPSRAELEDWMLQRAAAWVASGGSLRAVTRPMLALFRGRPGARAYRRWLSTHAGEPGAGVEVLRQALAFMREADGQAQDSRLDGRTKSDGPSPTPLFGGPRGEG